MPSKVCPQCGEQFTPNYKSQCFCSRACSNRSRKKRITLICEQCGKSFQRRPSYQDQRFCSYKCSAQSRKEFASCEYCGMEFWVKPNRDGKYCSIECYNEDRDGFIERNCQTCGKPFTVRKTRVRQGGGLFCGRDCFSQREQESVKDIQQCPTCGSDFEVFPSMPRTYCSVECYQQTLERNTETCEICGVEFEAAPASNRRFCSRKCMAQNMRVPGSDRYEYVGFTEALKERIRERDGRTCQLCASPEGDGPKLDVHHINYRKNDNRGVNLISLCHSCHSSTHHNRSVWQRYFEYIMKYRGLS